MNPIDDINSRIQEITNRIREIQNLGRRPPGNDAAASGGARAAGAGENQTATGAADPAAFKTLLEQALAQSQAPGASVAGTGASDGLGLSGLGDLGSIDSLLGGGDSSTTLSTDNAARLAEYRKLLETAIQELHARKNQGPGQ